MTDVSVESRHVHLITCTVKTALNFAVFLRSKTAKMIANYV